MNFGQGETVLESVSFEARGEASKDPKPTVLSCGGLFFKRDKLPTKTITWREIINMPSPEISNRLFGLKPATYQWNPYLEEAIYAN